MFAPLSQEGDVILWDLSSLASISFKPKVRGPATEAAVTLRQFLKDIPYTNTAMLDRSRILCALSLVREKYAEVKALEKDEKLMLQLTTALSFPRFVLKNSILMPTLLAEW